MAYYTTTLSSSQGTTDYAQSNDLVGQIATAITRCSLATIISDSNPVSSSSRIIFISIGDCQHQLKIYAYDKTNIGCQLMNVANSTYLLSYSQNAQNYILRMVYSAKSLAVNLSFSSNNYIVYSYGSDSHCHPLTTGTNSAAYDYNADTGKSLNYFYTGTFQNIDGTNSLFPVYTYTTNTIYLYFNFVFSGLYNMIANNIYFDGTNYYLSTTGYYLVSDKES